MSYEDGWYIDIPKTMKKYESSGDLGYPDGRFYRKEKSMVTLKDDGRACRKRKIDKDC